MVSVTLSKVGKQYNSDWIFADVTGIINPDSPTVIIGSNGSGKSTLLQIILSAITPTLGTVSYHKHNIEVKPEDAFRLMSISAPYIELIEEFTLHEMIALHSRLKPLKPTFTVNKVIDLCRLNKSSAKMIRNFSSGMKQRVKLALAILSDTPVLLLDEPTSNLDQFGIDWYKELIDEFKKNRTVVVSSNSIEQEYWFCNQKINLEDHKTTPKTDPSLLLF